MLIKFLKKKAVKKGVEVGVEKGTEIAKKIDEKTQISQKVEDHKKEIIVSTLVIVSVFSVGYSLGKRKRKLSVMDRINQKKKLKKRQRRMKMAKQGAFFLLKQLRNRESA